MPSIGRRPDGTYRERWREYPGGPQKTRHFERKREAENCLDGVRGDLVHGIYIDPAGGRTLFRDYAESWLAAQVHRASTAAQAETYLRLHAYPTLGPLSPWATTARSDPSQRGPGVGQVSERQAGARISRDLQGGCGRPCHCGVAVCEDRFAKAG
jgi:hypothetical protein